MYEITNATPETTTTEPVTPTRVKAKPGEADRTVYATLEECLASDKPHSDKQRPFLVTHNDEEVGFTFAAIAAEAKLNYAISIGIDAEVADRKNTKREPLDKAKVVNSLSREQLNEILAAQGLKVVSKPRPKGDDTTETTPDGGADDNAA